MKPRHSSNTFEITQNVEQVTKVHTRHRPITGESVRWSAPRPMGSRAFSPPPTAAERLVQAAQKPTATADRPLVPNRSHTGTWVWTGITL